MSGPGLTRELAAALEAARRPRTGLSVDDVDPAVRAGPKLGLSPDALRSAVQQFVCERPIEWAERRLTQGELLAGFARHCADELDEVAVEASSRRCSSHAGGRR